MKQFSFMSMNDDMEKNDVGWCLIPPFVLAKTDIGSSEKVVFGRVMGLSKKWGFCNASNEWLGEGIGLTGRGVSNIVSKLKKKDYVKVELIRGKDKQIIERRIYPLWNFYGGGIAQTCDRGIAQKCVGSKRDISKRVERANDESFADNGNEVNKIIDLFKDANPSYSKLFRNRTQRAAVERMLKQHGQEKLEGAILYATQIQGEKYAPRITTPLELENKLGHLRTYYLEKSGKKSQGKVGIAI